MNHSFWFEYTWIIWYEDEDENDDDTADEAELTRSNKVTKKKSSGGLPLEDSFHDTVLSGMFVCSSH